MKSYLLGANLERWLLGKFKVRLLSMQKTQWQENCSLGVEKQGLAAWAGLPGPVIHQVMATGWCKLRLFSTCEHFKMSKALSARLGRGGPPGFLEGDVWRLMISWPGVSSRQDHHQAPMSQNTEAIHTDEVLMYMWGYKSHVQSHWYTLCPGESWPWTWLYSSTVHLSDIQGT